MAFVINSIPASALVSLEPSVLSAGGAALNLTGLLLTTNYRAPYGQVLSFASSAAVGAYFGLSSKEYAASLVYFAGFAGGTATPGSLLFTQYPITPVGAYLRGGPVSNLTLTQLQNTAGTLSVVIDGITKSGNVNLLAASSFSNAAALISSSIGATPLVQSVFTGSVSGSTLVVTAVTTGALAPGQTLNAASVAAGTMITAFGTGSGGIGNYTVNNSQSVASEAMQATVPAVSYDSTSGAFVVSSSTTGGSSSAAYATGTVAAPLGLTQAVGAVLSQGSAPAVPGPFMTSVTNQTQNWATFSSLFDPDTVGATGNAQKMLFAAWVNAQNDRYAYFTFDTDITATQSGGTTNMGYLLAAGNYSGTALFYEPLGTPFYNAVFAMSIAASLNFSQAGGATDFAFRTQPGLGVAVTNAQIAANLIANGYNFYGTYATATTPGNIIYPGAISGPFQWIDAYVEQIQLNAALQQALFLLPQQIGTIPFNGYGAGLIESSLYGTPQSPGPIDQALSFGSIEVGVTLTAAQVQAVNAAAGGIDVATTLQARGWYLLVAIPSPAVRAARGPWFIQFWYTQGGSAQSFNLSSVLVQ